MKKLIFVRHGRAEEQSPEFSDFERSLTPKGKNITRLMAKRLKEIEKTHGVIITSPAFRALETAIIFGQELGIRPEQIITESNIYHKMSLPHLFDILTGIDEESNTIILFGHNPSFTEMVDSLSREGCDFMPKTSIAGISFKIKTWSEIKRNAGKLEYFLKPEKSL